MPTRPNVLVLCTGNSCRSQMAEALLRKHAGDRLEAYSAGSEPSEQVHPLSYEVMAEVGLDLAGQRPKHLATYLGKVPMAAVITVCDSAAQACPAWPGDAERLHWPFEDPAAFEGDREATLEKFREVRDAIEARILEWLAAR